MNQDTLNKIFEYCDSRVVRSLSKYWKYKSFKKLQLCYKIHINLELDRNRDDDELQFVYKMIKRSSMYTSLNTSFAHCTTLSNSMLRSIMTINSTTNNINLALVNDLHDNLILQFFYTNIDNYCPTVHNYKYLTINLLQLSNIINRDTMVDHRAEVLIITHTFSINYIFALYKNNMCIDLINLFPCLRKMIIINNSSISYCYLNDDKPYLYFEGESIDDVEIYSRSKLTIDFMNQPNNLSIATNYKYRNYYKDKTDNVICI